METQQMRPFVLLLTAFALGVACYWPVEEEDAPADAADETPDVGDDDDATADAAEDLADTSLDDAVHEPDTTVDDAPDDVPSDPANDDAAPVFPTLTGIELVDLDDGDFVIPRSIVTVRVAGTDMGGASVSVEVYGTLQATDRTELLETHEVDFEATPDGEMAILNWTVAGDILSRAGTNEVYFRAVFGDQHLTSPSVFVEVIPAIDAVRIIHESPLGTRELASDDSFPVEGQLLVQVDASGLVGETLTLEVHYVEADDVVVASLDETIASDQVDFVHVVDDEDVTGDTLGVYFRAVAEPLERVSPTVYALFSGIYDCAWTYDDGTVIGDGATVPVRTAVRMRVWTWGFDGTEAKFEIWEDDGVADNDWVADYFADVVEGLAESSWTTFFTDDGVFDNTDEYYFRVRRLGAHLCYSGIINVPR
jgi:hypothetical protein